MIVLDASAAIDALLNSGEARALLAHEQCHAPELIDVEVASALRRHVARGQLVPDAAAAALAAWVNLGITRHSHRALLARIWTLRDNVSSYDATYVALAEALECDLVTADSRLAAAPGAVCVIRVLPEH